MRLVVRLNPVYVTIVPLESCTLAFRYFWPALNKARSSSSLTAATLAIGVGGFWLLY